jgi:hypothetical protein
VNPRLDDVLTYWAVALGLLVGAVGAAVCAPVIVAVELVRGR